MPTFEITSPDGKKYRVTGENAEGAYQALQSHLGGSQQPKQPEQSYSSGLADAAFSGLTFGFGDELEAGFDALTGYKRSEGDTGFKNLSDFGNFDGTFSERYQEALKSNRGARDKFQSENPASAIGAEIVGGLATGAGLAKGGATLVGRTAGKGLLTRMAAGAGEGALYGAGYGAGNADEGSRLAGAAKGAALGGAIGGAIPAVGAGLRKGYQSVASNAATRKAAPSAEALKQQASDAFKSAENAGVRLSNRSRGTLTQGISDDLQAAKYRPSVNKEVKQVLDEFDSFIEAEPSLSNLQDYRSFVVKQMRNIAPDKKTEKELLGAIVENIDNYAERISPLDVITNASSRNKAVADLKQGRELWKRMRKDEILGEAFFKAENQASGFENGLRTQFRSILNNKRLRSQFSKDEVNAMIKVVQGGVTENTLKVLGKLGFGVDGASNAFGGTMGIGLGGLAGGPIGSMMVAGGATAARKGAEMATRRNAELARALVRSGKITQVQAPAVIKALEDGTLNPEVVAGVLATTN